jgi:hypothetical protein
MREFIPLGRMLRRFNYERLSRLRGKAHEGIIGEWIRWWLDIDSYNYVYNPAPYLENKSADIMFLGFDRNFVHVPKGVAEIENNKKKWFEKLEYLQTIVLSKEFSEMEFALLCVTVKLKSKSDQQVFNELTERMKVFSQKTKNVNWILCRLDQSPPKEETCFVFFGEEAKDYKRSISGGSCLIIKEGEIRFAHNWIED